MIFVFITASSKTLEKYVFTYSHKKLREAKVRVKISCFLTVYF